MPSNTDAMIRNIRSDHCWEILDQSIAENIVYLAIVFYNGARAVRALRFGLLHWQSRQRQHYWEIERLASQSFSLIWWLIWWAPIEKPQRTTYALFIFGPGTPSSVSPVQCCRHRRRHDGLKPQQRFSTANGSSRWRSSQPCRDML